MSELSWTILRLVLGKTREEHRKARTQTLRRQTPVRTVLCFLLLVYTIRWCLSRAIRQMEKVEVKENKSGRKVAS